MSVDADTLARQRRASDPAASAWVSANAGAGKTHVLASRVVRLLLNGTPPSRILCLTYTKAAAANMSKRIFETLAGWARAPDHELDKKIAETGAPAPKASERADARRLFARAVETPGGLKILTLHGFCQRLLQLFPFEANVPAAFATVEGLQEAELLALARRQTFAQAAREPDGPLARAVAAFAAEITSKKGLDDILREALGRRGDLRAIMQHGSLDAHGRALRERLGLQPGETRARIERAMLDAGLLGGDWRGLCERLERGAKTAAGLAASLRAAAIIDDRALRLAAYVGCLLSDAGEPRKRERTLDTGLRRNDPSLTDAIAAEQDRLVALGDRAKAADCLARTQALLAVADAMAGFYARAKNDRALLDYDDLIARADTLLSRSDAAWVLYKLDAGIDHVLVDEAQDTSPAQWRILNAVAADFWSGAGARGVTRTFFAAEFARQRARLRGLVRAAAAFNDEKLLTSFRSTPAVMKAVDAVFSIPENYKGLSGEGEQTKTDHETVRLGIPGHVELWPVFQAEKQEHPEDWLLPLDAVRADAPPAVVARRVADEIGRLVAPDGGARVHDRKLGAFRAITPGDILILVRSRSAFFETVIRTLKERGIRVAGADRLALAAHIAVQDLMAAGRAALLPQDDLSLACVLKSPLIGLDDDDLLAFAPQRGDRSLWEGLRDWAAHSDKAAKAAARVAAWRARALHEAPFQFYARILGEEGGRRDFLSRLGPEARDALDEFLAAALQHQAGRAPSLLAFLQEFEAADIEVKRDMDHAGDAVRVMTVHGAKGLEAPVVFLPDTCGAPTRGSPRLLTLGQEPPLLAWSPGKATDSAVLAQARALVQEAAEDEHRRLLYVALTRAQDRLYVAGFVGVRGPADGCWHDMVRVSLTPELVPASAPWGANETVLRRADPLPPAEMARVAPQAMLPDVPNYLMRPAAPEASPAPPLRPSSALAAADFPEGGAPNAIAPELDRALQGRLMHRLLQYLPDVAPGLRRAAAERFVAARGASLPGPAAQSLVRDALGVLEDPRAAALFGEGSRAEVAIAGEIARVGGEPISVSGRIDRIMAGAAEVLIADFKTGAPRSAEATPPSYVAQLALYARVIGAIYPGRRVRAFVLWTQGPSVVELGAAQMDAAMAGLGAAPVAVT